MYKLVQHFNKIRSLSHEIKSWIQFGQNKLIFHARHIVLIIENNVLVLWYVSILMNFNKFVHKFTFWLNRAKCMHAYIDIDKKITITMNLQIVNGYDDFCHIIIKLNNVSHRHKNVNIVFLVNAFRGKMGLVGHMQSNKMISSEKKLPCYMWTIAFIYIF